MHVAGYHVAGWYDMSCESAIALWRDLRESATTAYARESQRLTIGYWPHGIYGTSVPEVDFGAEASLWGSGAGPRMTGWLRDAVDGKPVEGGVRAFVMGVNRWWDLDDWPPPSRPVEMYLGSGPRGARSSRGDGTLRGRPDAAGHDRYRHDPDDPVPTRGGRLLGLAAPAPGVYDQREVEARDDVLVYTTDSLDGDLTIAGTVEVRLTVASDAPTADLVAKLVDVHPDGRALNILDSIQRCLLLQGVLEK
jgi:putative CocE/NonD family hydrolase